MAIADDTVIAVADVYAGALLAISEPRGVSEEVRDQLADLAAYLKKDTVFAGYLQTPAVESNDRKQTIERLFRGKLDDALVDTLQVLNAKDRGGIVATLAERYRLKLAALRNEIDVRVTTAAPLDDDSRAQLKEAISKHTARTPVLVEELDEALIGGLVVRMGDRKMDNSVARHLQRVHDQLLERASREIYGGKAYFEGVA